MKQIMRDSSGYYLLGYTSSRAPIDGRFHEIKVQVKRRGVNVRARKGYWALTKADVERATAPAKPEAPPAVTKALDRARGPVARPRREILDRHGARRERQDPRDDRVGAGRAAAGAKAPMPRRGSR